MFAAALMRLWGLGFGLPNSDARPDEVTLAQIALGLLFAGLNPHFFHWPTLEMYVVAAIYRVAFEVGHYQGVYRLKFDMFRAAMLDPSPYLMVTRTISVMAGVVTVWIVYRVARRLFDEATAIVAAFFIAVAYLHVRDSHFGVTDVPMTCLAIATLLPLARALDAPAPLRTWILAGALAGFTASTKYNGGVIVCVGVATAFAAAVADGESRWKTAARRASAVLAAAALAFLAGTPFAALDARSFFDGLQFDSRHLAGGHGIVLGRGWWYHLSFTLRYGLGTPLLLAGIAGMVVIAVRSWRKAVVVCTFPVLYFVLVGAGSTVFVRYMIPVVPFLCLAAGAAIVEISRRLARSFPPGTVPLVMGALAFLVALPSIGRVVAFDRLMTRTDTRVLASDWLDRQASNADWMGESPDGIVHPEWGRSPGLHVARFDAERRQFVSQEGQPLTPAWVALASSPLSVYTSMPESLAGLLQSQYSLAATFVSSERAERAGSFDQQDRFFVPFADYSARLRPGPDIQIYRRRVP